MTQPSDFSGVEDLSPEDLLGAVRAFLHAIPHAKALNMHLESIGGGKAVLSMPWDERFVGDPRTGVIHGGAISALMDTCSGAAVLSHPEAGPATATLDLRIDYMRSATPGQRITARAEVYRLARTIAFMRAVATDEEDGLPVATATGAFTVERRPHDEAVPDTGDHP